MPTWETTIWACFSSPNRRRSERLVLSQPHRRYASTGCEAPCAGDPWNPPGSTPTNKCKPQPPDQGPGRCHRGPRLRRWSSCTSRRGRRPPAPGTPAPAPPGCSGTTPPGLDVLPDGGGGGRRIQQPPRFSAQCPKGVQCPVSRPRGSGNEIQKSAQPKKSHLQCPLRIFSCNNVQKL